MTHSRPRSTSIQRSNAPEDLTSPAPLARLPQEFLDEGPIREVPAARWAALFDRMGVHGLRTEDDVIRFLTAPELEPIWLDLLQKLHDLGTETGIEALFEAAATIGLSTEDWPEHAREIAAEIWVRSQRDPQRGTYERLLLLATIVLHERRPAGADRHYVGKESGPCRVPLRKAVPHLEDRLRPWFVRHHLGDYVEVKVRPEEEDFCLCIQRGGRSVARRVVRGQSQTTLRFQPAQTDVIRYEAFTGRLRVMASTERLLDEYSRAVGAAMFGDASFFTGAKICDLAPLRDLLIAGQLLPTASPRRGIVAVRLLNCLWVQEHGLGMRIFGERTSDFIGRIRRSGLRIEEGQVTEAQFEFAFRGRVGTERIRVKVRAPIHVRVPSGARREQVEGYLADIGILDEGKIVLRTERVDLWTLGDAPHVLPRWNPVCRSDAREAIRVGLLREQPLQAAVRDGRITPVLPIESEDRIDHVLIPDEGVAGVGQMVAAEELVGYRLEELSLASVLAQALGCMRSPTPTSIAGCIDLGSLELNRTRVRPFLLTQRPSCADGTLLAALQALAQSAQVVAIVPPSRTLEPALRTVFLDHILPPFDHLRPEIVDVLGLAEAVPVIDRAPRSARVVIDKATRTAFLDRTEITPLSDQLWTLLILLAEAQVNGKSLSSDQISRALPGAADGAVFRRTSDAKRYLLERIKKAFADHHHPVPADLKGIVNIAGGACRLAFLAYIA